MDIELLSVIIFALFFAWIGWKLREFHAMRVVRKHFEEHKTLMAQKEDDVLMLHLHRVGDMVYVYNDETSAFLLQTKNRSDIHEYMTKNYPDFTVSIKNEHRHIYEGMIE